MAAGAPGEDPPDGIDRAERSLKAGRDSRSFRVAILAATLAALVAVHLRPGGALREFLFGH